MLKKYEAARGLNPICGFGSRVQLLQTVWSSEVNSSIVNSEVLRGLAQGMVAERESTRL